MTSPFAGAAAEMAKANPANEPPKTPARRVPMSLPTLKLEIPAIPGYVCHWFRGTGQRIAQAQNAGYEFVNRDDVSINHVGLASDYLSDGNSDLGSRVSVSAGGDSPEGQQGLRLYLMKIKRELFEEDQIALDEQHEQVAAQLRGDRGFGEAAQADYKRHTAQKTPQRNMFTPNRKV